MGGEGRFGVALSTSTRGAGGGEKRGKNVGAGEARLAVAQKRERGKKERGRLKERDNRRARPLSGRESGEGGGAS